MMNYLIVLFACVFVNNCVFNQVYGICPFLGVSKKTSQAFGMGIAVTFVMTAATAVTYPIRYFLLARFSLDYLETIVFILVIAALVQFLETAMKKYIPALHRSLGIYLPLITTNCAVLGVTVDNIAASYNFLTSVFAAAGSGLGFLLAMILFSGVRSRTENADAPASWKGLPLTLAAAAIVSLSFKGFEGMIAIPPKTEAPSLYRDGTVAAVTGENIGAQIAIAVLIVTLLGLLAAALLALSSRFMAVKEDERLPAVRGALPGANCGACGFAGCDGYAKALLGEDAPATNRCVPGGAAVASALSKILGRECAEVESRVAVVSCDGNCGVAPLHNRYVGIPSCAAAKMFYGGPSACAYGCIGYGDCAAVCPQNAVCIEDGVAHIDTRSCVGCGLCKDACPQGIIRLMPDKERVAVICSSHAPGAVTRRECTNGCIGCKKCEKVCPKGAVKVTDNLARIDYNLCIACRACTEACPTGAIIYADLSGYHRLKRGTPQA